MQQENLPSTAPHCPRRHSESEAAAGMNLIAITNRDTGWQLGSQVKVAATMAERIKGLLGTSHLPPGRGLLLRPCYSIHTFGMTYAIDVLFLDHDYCVLKIVDSLPPMRLASCWAGQMTLELPAGTAAWSGTQVGHRLQAIDAGQGENFSRPARR